MSQDKVDTIALFKKLISGVNNDDSKLILESCNNILQALPDDKDAQKCRIVCYINMGKYDEAIKVIDKSAHDFSLEHVYCLYLKQMYSEAFALLKKKNDSSQNARLLEAQILYRMERYEESLKVYQGLTKSDEYDYITNLSASYLLSNNVEEGASLLEKYKTSQSYEVLYNYGTLLIYSNRYDEAEEVLKRALSVGRMQLREDDEMEIDVEEDKGTETELDPIRIQLAYLAVCRGNQTEAERILTAVLSHPTTSKVITAIASSNIIAARGCTEMADGLKRLKTISNETFNKLTATQQNAIRFNKAMLLLLMNRKKEFESMLIEIKEYSMQEVRVLQVCEKIIRDKAQEAISEVEEALKNKPVSDQLYLLCLQLYLNQHLYEKSIELITSFPSSLFNTAGIQSLFFNLCKHLDAEQSVHNYLKSFDSLTSELSGQDLFGAQEMASDYFFEKKQYDEASTRLQALLSSNTMSSLSRMEIMSKLVLSTVFSSPTEAIRLAQQLPDVDIVENVDMNELEEMLRRRDYLKKTTTVAAAALSPVTTPREEMEVEEEPVPNVVTSIRKIEAEKKRKQNMKKRARKTAKFVAMLKEAGKYQDPSSLDPERWLAKEDRTQVKRRKKMTVSITGVGAQGDHVSQAEMDKYDAKKRNETPNTNQAKVIVDKSKVRRKKGGKKGKK